MVRRKGGVLPVLVEKDAGFDVEGYRVGHAGEERRVVVWDEREIINKAAGVGREGWGFSWEGFVRVINEVAGCVERVCAVWVTIEHVGIHGADEGVVFVGGLFGGYQDAHALAGGEIYKVSFLSYGVDAIDFDDGHLVLIKLDKEGGECGLVDYSGHVSFAGGDFERCRCIVIENGRVRNRFCPVRIGCYR